ncbi:MAG TPA: hypothetical protein PKE21_12345 [Flavobacteriales bacterium]|nr:hypothetical protein [Flavobacteriales bacterium]HMR28264.1 hypothetical protein [Flavobacteriales bacterium]
MTSSNRLTLWIFIAMVVGSVAGREHRATIMEEHPIAALGQRVRFTPCTPAHPGSVHRPAHARHVDGGLLGGLPFVSTCEGLNGNRRS